MKKNNIKSYKYPNLAASLGPKHSLDALISRPQTTNRQMAILSYDFHQFFIWFYIVFIQFVLYLS